MDFNKGRSSQSHYAFWKKSTGIEGFLVEAVWQRSLSAAEPLFLFIWDELLLSGMMYADVRENVCVMAPRRHECFIRAARKGHVTATSLKSRACFARSYETMLLSFQ